MAFVLQMQKSWLLGGLLMFPFGVVFGFGLPRSFLDPMTSSWSWSITTGERGVLLLRNIPSVKMREIAEAYPLWRTLWSQSLLLQSLATAGREASWCTCWSEYFAYHRRACLQSRPCLLRFIWQFVLTCTGGNDVNLSSEWQWYQRNILANHLRY